MRDVIGMNRVAARVDTNVAFFTGASSILISMRLLAPQARRFGRGETCPRTTTDLFG
jgi:hypothetical protein